MRNLKFLPIILILICFGCHSATMTQTPGSTEDSVQDGLEEVDVGISETDPSPQGTESPAGDDTPADDNTSSTDTPSDGEDEATPPEEDKGITAAQTMAIIEQVLF